MRARCSSERNSAVAATTARVRRSSRSVAPSTPTEQEGEALQLAHLQGLEEHVLAAGEHPVDRRPGDPGRGGDVVDGDLFEPPSLTARLGGVEHPGLDRQHGETIRHKPSHCQRVSECRTSLECRLRRSESPNPCSTTKVVTQTRGAPTVASRPVRGEIQPRPFPIVGWLSVARGGSGSSSSCSSRSISLYLLLQFVARIQLDRWWYDSVTDASIWSTIVGAKLVLAIVAGGVTALVLGGTVALALRFHGVERAELGALVRRYRDRMGPAHVWLLVAVVVFLTLRIGASATGQWQSWLLFRHGPELDQQVPELGTDLGYHLFDLPFLTTVSSWIRQLLLVRPRPHRLHATRCPAPCGCRSTAGDRPDPRSPISACSPPPSPRPRRSTTSSSAGPRSPRAPAGRSSAPATPSSTWACRRHGCSPWSPL